MAYCTLADVYPLIGSMGQLRDTPVPPATTPPATVPTATQGAQIIEMVGAEIDMHLQRRGYALPIAEEDTKTLGMLKGLCASGAAARILKSRYPAAKGAGSDEGALAVAREDYLAGLKLIDEGGLGPVVAKSSSGVAHAWEHPCHREEAPF